MSKKKRSKEMFTEEQVKEFAKRLNEAIENSPYKNNVEVAKAARTSEANISRWRRGGGYAGADKYSETKRGPECTGR